MNLTQIKQLKWISVVQLILVFSPIITILIVTVQITGSTLDKIASDGDPSAALQSLIFGAVSYRVISIIIIILQIILSGLSVFLIFKKYKTSLKDLAILQIILIILNIIALIFQISGFINFSTFLYSGLLNFVIFVYSIVVFSISISRTKKMTRFNNF
ncbi:hypothetical protein [Mesomycoplasma conjunctivae]|uniref:hypothetical protein n=1 Tax=Mesomycoplasma conjunctivae TaxID=45361 RepID=UPI003DA5B864